MKKINVGILKIFSTLVVLGLSGCSLSKSTGDPSLSLDLSEMRNQANAQGLINMGGFHVGGANVNLALPATAASFPCYAVNVTGPGIGDSGGGGNNENPAVVFERLLNVPGTYCSYKGVVSPTIYLNGGTADINVKIPPGPIRLVQVIGVNDATVCASGVIDGGGDSSSGTPKYYEIGRAVVNNVFGDMSVEVNTSWPTTAGLEGDNARLARALDCGGSCQYPVNGPSVGIASYTSSFSLTTSGTNSKVAQKFTVPSTTYLRRAEVGISSAGAATVTALIYSDVTNSGISSATATGFSATAAIAGDNTNHFVSFNFFDPVNRYLQLQPGITYYLVLYVTGNAVTVIGSDTVGASINVQAYNGSSWNTDGSNKELFMKINACN